MSTLSEFWAANPPEKHISGAVRSRVVSGLIYDACPPPAKILEPGCNIGRNLEFLRLLGYDDFTGIEIAVHAIGAGRIYFPLVKPKILKGWAQDILPELPSRSFDATLTMAFLMHIPREDDFVVDEIARVTRKVIVTAEDEVRDGSRWWHRKYKDIYENLGFTQTFEVRADWIPALSGRFWIRRFERD